MNLDQNNAEWTPRQNMGFEYTQYSSNLPKEAHEVREDKLWKIEFQGKASDPPGIDRLSSGGGPFVIFYNLNSFVVTNKGCSKQLDLVDITPEDWSQKHIKLTSPNYMPPEVYEFMVNHEVINPVNQEIVIGEFLDSGSYNPKTIVKVCLWNTLVARFLSEIGEPASEESVKTMNQVLLERRSAVLDALSKDSNEDPVEIAKKPFS